MPQEWHWIRTSRFLPEPGLSLLRSVLEVRRQATLSLLEVELDVRLQLERLGGAAFGGWELAGYFLLLLDPVWGRILTPWDDDTHSLTQLFVREGMTDNLDG